MIIIIDGLDKTGKTTLGKYLMNELDNSIYIKSGINGDKVTTEIISKYYYRMLDFFKNNAEDFNIIIDRFYMSEYAYSFIRGYKYDGKFDDIEKELTKLPHIYIYCDSNIDKLELNDDYINKEQIQEVYDNYNYYNKRTLLNFRTYNYHFNDEKEVLEWISNSQ